jgi:hypothetical protein
MRWKYDQAWSVHKDSGGTKQIVLLDFIHRLVSQEQTKLRSDLLQGLMCVCAKVSCSVVSN